MRPPLSGVVLVTGASSGIGEVFARRLAAEAGVLVLVARRRERLEALADRLREERSDLMVHVLPCDLSDMAAMDSFLDRLDHEVGPVDILVNNAGLGDIALTEYADWSKLERMIQVNVVGLTRLTHHVLPGMVSRGRGGILNVSSGFGMTIMPAVAAYVGTKHYVTAFTESLRMELAGTGVVMTQVCPGPVATEFEANAGNPTGMAVPGWFELTAEACADQALAAFRRGRAHVVPGWLPWLAVTLGSWSPRWAMRWLYRPVGPWLRRRGPSV